MSALNIVTVNVTLEVAPTPNLLQQTGAFLSQGGTTKSPGTSTLLTQLSDLTSILTASAANTSITWTTNVATVTTTVAHGFTSADTLYVTIAGATPTAYNGTFLVTVTGTSTFTYALLSNPGGSASPAGTYVVANAAELLAMGTTYFAQGLAQSVYVLELGPGNAADGVTYLTTWLTANPGTYYALLVPQEWSAQSTFFTLIANYESTPSQLYFYCTASSGNYTSYTAAMKDAYVMIEAAAAPATEFSCAAPFYDLLSTSPGSSTPVAPFSFRYASGVTDWVPAGNGSTLTTYKTASLNYYLTGYEGGIANSVLFWGTYKDGNPVNFWYAVDWTQINVNLDISNAVINGSQPGPNPLYYNQNGVDRLQAVGAATLATGIASGMIFGTVLQTRLSQAQFNLNQQNGLYDGYAVINAAPLAGAQGYSALNPSDYAKGKYAGFTVAVATARGFTSIVFNVLVTQFIATP
jgi:hypothetical protein